MNHVLATNQNSLCVRRTNCPLDRDFPFRLMKGPTAHPGNLLEPLLSDSSPIIAGPRLTVNEFSPRSCHVQHSMSQKIRELAPNSHRLINCTFYMLLDLAEVRFASCFSGDNGYPWGNGCWQCRTIGLSILPHCNWKRRRSSSEGERLLCGTTLSSWFLCC
jgi:hypothetical protein